MLKSTHLLRISNNDSVKSRCPLSWSTLWMNVARYPELHNTVSHFAQHIFRCVSVLCRPNHNRSQIQRIRDQLNSYMYIRLLPRICVSDLLFHLNLQVSAVLLCLNAKLILCNFALNNWNDTQTVNYDNVKKWRNLRLRIKTRKYASQTIPNFYEVLFLLYYKRPVFTHSGRILKLLTFDSFPRLHHLLSRLPTFTRGFDCSLRIFMSSRMS